jgi:cell division protein FtsA
MQVLQVIALKEKEVTRKDIDRVIEAASAVAIPMDREVIHILTQEYVVDDQDNITDPLGMSGVRMEAKIHIVTGAVTSAQNIIKCANKAGLDVCDIVLESLASSEAVLSDEERNLGVALIDFGGGTTDMAIFSRGSIKHTSVLTLGGDNLTYDISIGLKTPRIEAEKIKIKFGCGLLKPSRCLAWEEEKQESYPDRSWGRFWNHGLRRYLALLTMNWCVRDIRISSTRAWLSQEALRSFQGLPK